MLQQRNVGHSVGPLFRISFIAALVFWLGAVVTAPTAEAAPSPERTFAGKILISDKPFPTKAKSPSAYISALRKQSKSAFQENKEKKQWKVFIAAFLRSPLPDLEIMVKIYDVTNRQQALVSSFEQYTNERGQRSIISSVVLDRKTFGVNRQLMIVMEYNGKVLASGTFKILGEAEKFSGKVDFSEDEAAGNE